MGNVIEITIWASGVNQDPEARDLAKCLAAAASKEGKFVQAFDNYVDLPDRVCVPVRKYVRISDEEIEDKYLYENQHPKIVVLIEPTLVKGYNVLRGMEKEGVLLLNSHRDPEEILKFIPNKKVLKKVATLDGWVICPQMSFDKSDSEGAGAGGQIGKGVGAVLAGATAKASGLVRLESVLEVVANKEAARRGYEDVTVKAID